MLAFQGIGSIGHKRYGQAGDPKHRIHSTWPKQLRHGYENNNTNLLYSLLGSDLSPCWVEIH